MHPKSSAQADEGKQSSGPSAIETREQREAAEQMAFHTGPSATADIEGVLIHGAQGVRSLSVLPLAQAAGNPTR
jgi:L-lactate utilization protein LutC